jgi:exopolyphosphatase/guanosine-5'-triphosphate,3'-diphosphate pyrophosphatase
MEKLAAMLRVADGLDRTHTNSISEINCRFDDELIKIQCRAEGPAIAEVEVASRKADLMRRAFGREVVIEIS